MKALLLTLVLSFASFAADEYKDAALALTAKQPGLQDLHYNNPQFQAIYQNIEAQTKDLFDNYLTDIGKDVFKMRLPHVQGELLISFGDAMQELLASGTMTLETLKAQFSEFKSLCDKYKVSSLKTDIAFFSEMSFDKGFNPKIVAEDFSALTITQFAEPNGYMGDGSDITRLANVRGHGTDSNGNRIPYEENITYIFNVKGGDCPAGCTEETNYYFAQDYSTRSFKFVGKVGRPIDEAKYFKNL